MLDLDNLVARLEATKCEDPDREWLRNVALEFLDRIEELPRFEQSIPLGAAFIVLDKEGFTPQDEVLIGLGCSEYLNEQAALGGAKFDVVSKVWGHGGMSSLARGRPCVFWHPGTGSKERQAFEEEAPQFLELAAKSQEEWHRVKSAAAMTVMYKLFFNELKRFDALHRSGECHLCCGVQGQTRQSALVIAASEFLLRSQSTNDATAVRVIGGIVSLLKGGMRANTFVNPLTVTVT